MIIEIGKTSFNLKFSFVALIVTMMLVCDEKIVLVSLISSLVHESGHLLFMYLTGVVPKCVEFSLFGMRIDRNVSSNLSYKNEFLIATGGIIFNLIFSALCYIIYIINENMLFLLITAVNIMIVIINSFPVGVLDFGRALRYILLMYFDGKKSEKLLNIISYVFVIIFSLITAVYCIIIGFNISLITLTAYLIFITIIKKWS